MNNICNKFKNIIITFSVLILQLIGGKKYQKFSLSFLLIASFSDNFN